MPISGNVAVSYRRSFQQTSEAVGHARCDVMTFARGCGFSGQILADIEVAVGEGLANAVEHGYRAGGEFEVTMRRDGPALVIEIKDAGAGFNHAAPTDRPPPVEAMRGFGRLIMRELMDEIDYSESGTRLRLLKRLPPEQQSGTSGT